MPGMLPDRSRPAPRQVCELPQRRAARSERIRLDHRRTSGVPEGRRGKTVGDKRQSVRRRVPPMRYEGGRPEPSPTARDIYAAWALVGAVLLALVLVSFA